MDEVELILVALLVAVAGLAAAARAINVPVPDRARDRRGGARAPAIGLPEIELDPELVLVIFLPPLLYTGAFFANLARPAREPAPDRAGGDRARAGHDGRRRGRGARAHRRHAWPAAFALGAIVGPTDPVAATAIARRLGVPRRLVSVLKGESLINDATALVAYNIAVRAATGVVAFSLLDAGWDFVWKAAGGSRSAWSSAG